MGINVKGMVESQWLKGSDLSATQQQILTINDVAQRAFQGEQKIVLGFMETTKRLICNKSQLKALAELFGYEATQWVDKRIAVYAAPSGFQDALTIKILPAPAAQAPTVNGVEVTFQGSPHQG